MKRKTNKKATTEAEATTNELLATSSTQINRDVMTAVLIVSLLVNLFVLTAWVTLQVTTAYDAQVASFLFAR